MSQLEGTLDQSFMAAGAPAGGVGSSKDAPRGGRTAKARKFYIVLSQARSRAAGLRLVNEDELLRDGSSTLSPPAGRRGFRDYPVTPLFLADEKLGRIDRDFERYSHYWLISDRMKSVLEQVDPEAFAFLKCDTRLPDGTDGPRHWLCDVVRVLEALDEGKSLIEIGTADDGSKFYDLLGRRSLILNQDAIGPCRVFRMKYTGSVIICDDVLKRACRENGITGIRFKGAVEGLI